MYIAECRTSLEFAGFEKLEDVDILVKKEPYTWNVHEVQVFGSFYSYVDDRLEKVCDKAAEKTTVASRRADHVANH